MLREAPAILKSLLERARGQGRGGPLGRKNISEAQEKGNRELRFKVEEGRRKELSRSTPVCSRCSFIEEMVEMDAPTTSFTMAESARQTE